MKINSQMTNSTIKINTESSLPTVFRVELICLKVKRDNLVSDEVALSAMYRYFQLNHFNYLG